MANASAGSAAASQPTSGISTPQFQTRSRTQSVSSDRPSTIMSVGLMSPPLSVTPEAAFIAASAASQIVTNDHDSHADTWYDQHGIEPAGETAMVSAAALRLVNSFLDQLLFNFLSSSRATTLAALRPAVSEVLKPKLAKDAISQADEELREYLGGADEDDFVQPQGAEPRDWDLELVWKRTRLRCMVYSSLGDMEEEDEDFYMDQENLKPGIDERGPEVISPAVAIFLTSILEYMGEQALVIAGQAAYHRLRAKFEKEPKEGAKSIADIADRIVVEELDMERVALDRTLGRLWRAWKKRLRSPTLDARPFSRTSSVHRKQSSAAENRESPLSAKGLGIQEAPREEPEIKQVDNHIEASVIPLPIGDRDVDEIEVPGLASYSDEEGSDRDEEEPVLQRPKSLMIFTSQPSDAIPTPTMSQPHTPTVPSGRKRSNSLPTPSPSPYTSPVLKRAKIDPIETGLADQQAGFGAKEISTEAIHAQPQSVGNSQASPGVLEPVQESVEVESQAEPEKPPEPKPRNPNRISQIGVTAAALGAAAVAGVASFATGKALESKPRPTEEENGDIDDFTEEPEICTSSRVSIAGRSSPSISESGKAVVVTPKLLQRTPSVHSARVVDVHGPKSPVAASRTSSVDASDRSQPVSLSRANSVSRTTPQIIEEKPKPKPAEIETIIRSSSSTPRTRSPNEKLSRRQNTSESISEVDEDAEVRPTRQDKARTATAASSPTPTAGTPDIRSSQAFSSSVRQTGSSRHNHTSSATKVTILSDTHTNGAIIEDRVPSPRNRSHATPGVPERNTARPTHGTHSPAASIGVVTVERPAAGRDSPDRNRHLRTSGSSGSSITGKIRAVRNSEDSKASGRADNLPRNFEELIQSDQTIQYTLTPENMRDLDVCHA
ncbi:FLO11-like protein [Colletotrichum tofieldiae]|nr:FLO11-like protein [Colletotrichum tofieldiae]GKT68404.1 FLO11-like protein [Colletotrichum tofieldiae]